jgi:hypothetical protein
LQLWTSFFSSATLSSALNLSSLKRSVKWKQIKITNMILQRL